MEISVRRRKIYATSPYEVLCALPFAEGTLMIEPALQNASPLRKWSIFLIGAVLYILVYFYRFSPAVLAEPMAADLGVTQAAVGYFATMYFWPYGLMQPIVGALSDIFDPGVLIGVAGFVSSIGTIIFALSTALWVSYLGRFVVGIGCSCVFVPMLKVLGLMFPRDYYQHIPGAFLVFGGLGGIIAQEPLAALCSSIGWRMSLVVLATIGVFFASAAFFAIRIPRVAPSEPSSESSSMSTSHSLSENLIKVLKIPQFWIVSIFSFAGPGAFMDVTTFWGIPYLMQSFGYSLQQASSIAMSLSFGLMIFPPILASIASRVGSKRWVLTACCLIGSMTCFLLAFADRKLGLIGLIICLLVFSASTSASQSISLAMYGEMAESYLTATITGCGNSFPFFGAATAQLISSGVIGSYQSPYPHEAFMYGLWVVCGIFSLIGSLGPALYRQVKVEDSGYIAASHL